MIALFAVTLYNTEKFEEAIPLFKKSIRHNPFPPAWYLSNLAGAYIKAGQYEDAIKAIKRALAIDPKMYFAHLTLIANLSRLGRDSEAKAAVKEFLSLYPDFSIAEGVANMGFHKNKNRAMRDLFIADLSKAGLK